jgi:hypothetical protein
MMRVLKIVPAPDAAKIHCAACGDESAQADIPRTIVDASDAKPLCDACLRLLQAGKALKRADHV